MFAHYNVCLPPPPPIYLLMGILPQILSQLLQRSVEGQVVPPFPHCKEGGRAKGGREGKGREGGREEGREGEGREGG